MDHYNMRKINVVAVFVMLIANTVFAQVETDIPCSGQGFQSDSIAFRIQGAGESENIFTAKKLAMINALENMEESIAIFQMLYDRIKVNDQLYRDFDYEKYKRDFVSEMSKSED